MKKTNKVFILVLLILSGFNVSFGMIDDEEYTFVAPTVAASAKSGVVPVGLVNDSGSDCFVNSTIQALYAMPEFAEFLIQHQDDYALNLGVDEGEFFIPLQFINVFKQLRTSAEEPLFYGPKGIEGSNLIRAFVCRNSSNPALRGMKEGQHDAGEFLRLVLEYFQYYTKYHFDILQKSYSFVENKFLMNEVIAPSLKQISDFNNVDLLSFESFMGAIQARIDIIRLDIARARLKTDFISGNVADFFEAAEAVNGAIAQLQQQGSEEFYSRIMHLPGYFTETELGTGKPGIKSAFDLLKRLASGAEISTDEQESLSVCFGKDMDGVVGWVSEKVGRLTSLSDAEIRCIGIKPDLLDQISTSMNSVKDELEDSLANIQRIVTEIRGLFAVIVSGYWQIGLNLSLPLNDFDALDPLIKLSNRPDDPYPLCKVSDLLGREEHMINANQALLPKILIMNVPSFASNTVQLPLVNSFLQCFPEYVDDIELSKLNRGDKIPLSFSPDEFLHIGQQNYELIGVIYHRGHSVSGGHYIASCKYQGEWEVFDDTQVLPLSFEHIICDRTDMLDCFIPHVVIYRKTPQISATEQVAQPLENKPLPHLIAEAFFKPEVGEDAGVEETPTSKAAGAGTPPEEDLLDV